MVFLRSKDFQEEREEEKEEHEQGRMECTTEVGGEVERLPPSNACFSWKIRLFSVQEG